LGDNDLALGQVVEGLSKSRFWKEMAIFVVEDDAQNGSDHVDAHRTVALAISPYVKRHVVDSSMYSTSSMLRTMEFILGLEPMSQFDASARPMYGSFTPQAEDRKSTRLNSSHGSISYAAFCLKKKNNTYVAAISRNAKTRAETNYVLGVDS